MPTEPVHVPAETLRLLSSAWRRCVGTGRMNLSLRRGHREALALAREEIGFEMIRGHGMLSDDMGVYREVEWQGERQVRHVFAYLDEVVDSYLATGVRPFLELGFMPEALASGDQTVFWWKGNVTPPRSYPEWQGLVRGTLRHLVDRYGIEEVRTWPVEVWNEPNLSDFWQGADQAEYLRLYEATAHAVKEVDAELQVGGPVLSPGADEWWAPFAEFVTRREVPVDFVSRHAYTSGPAQHVPFGVYQDLRPPQHLLEQFAAPAQHLTGTALAGLPVHISEFNTSYRPDNPVHDTAYNAAYLAPVLAAGGEHVESFSYWTVSDVFEEAGVPASIFHGGFGLLTHGLIRKPTYHLYAFMARLGEEVLAEGVDHLVTRHADGRLAVLAWQPVDGSPVTAADRHHVRLSVPVGAGVRRTGTGAGSSEAPQPGQPRTAFVLRRRVNESDGNAWTAWQDLGRPASPGARHLDLLLDASRPAVEHSSVAVHGGRVELDLHLAQHEVTLVEVEAVRDSTPPWLDDTRIPGYGRP
ncbi:GH39 family glycosyl hydrolase [Actinotalea soli]|uniref:GH39 family glycosyl hydrolase n=1 Tax=Actinotalea soli TaxID=2819234 RepID=UPI0027DDF605|nr:xylan 1,4-beta-xylosidase [Actinotalea soli]